MRDQKGQVLIVVFALLLLVGVLVAGISLIWQSGANTAYLERDSLRAFYIAQSGIERARAEIAAAADDNYEASFPNQPLGGGSYDLAITKKNASTKVVTSTGRFGNSTRSIKTEITVTGGGPPYGNAWGANKKNGQTWQEQ